MKKKSLYLAVFILIFVIVYFATNKKTATAQTYGITLSSNSLGLKSLKSGFPAFKTSASCGELVNHKSLSLMYCESFEQSLWVAYILTNSQINDNDKLERSNKFVLDPDVKTGSAVSSDYSKTGFDRGHLAPNGDMNWDQQSMDECFYMSNISPQVPELNRGTWKDLEFKVRQWATEMDSLYIVTGPDLQGVTQFIGEKNKVGVPLHFYKVILDVKGPEYNGIAFYMNNEKNEADIFKYAMSIKDLEKILHANFFPNLNPKIMDKVEANLNLKYWKN